MRLDKDATTQIECLTWTVFFCQFDTTSAMARDFKNKKSISFLSDDEQGLKGARLY